MSRPLLTWGGLDFDTAAMDTEIREALAALAPEGGALRALKVTATITEALAALDDDFDGRGATWSRATPEGAMALCCDRLERARVQLEEAHEALRSAQRMLGLVSS